MAFTLVDPVHSTVRATLPKHASEYDIRLGSDPHTNCSSLHDPGLNHTTSSHWSWSRSPDPLSGQQGPCSHTCDCHCRITCCLSLPSWRSSHWPFLFFDTRMPLPTARPCAMLEIPCLSLLPLFYLMHLNKSLTPLDRPHPHILCSIAQHRSLCERITAIVLNLHA